VILLIAAPLMRGGNRQIALVGLEAISVAVLLSAWARYWLSPARLRGTSAPFVDKAALYILVLSPAWLAIVYLLPLPIGVWNVISGRAPYLELMRGAGFAPAAGMPLSLVPDATKASLLAGLPLIAAFVAGYGSRLSQLKTLLAVVAGMAFLQLLLGFFQAAGGRQSALYFAVEFGGRPLGTFANTNHFANYLGLALMGYIWLGWASLTESSSRWTDGVGVRFAGRHAQIFWVAGGLALAIGILMSFSRGAALSVLPAALLAAGVAIAAGGSTRSWRMTLLLLGGVLLLGAAIVGLGAVLSRFDLGRLSVDASFRTLLAKSTLAGASEFWPWGAGWGTYGSVYPRFQPVAVDGSVEYAHEDYAQLLFEGGIFAVVLVTAFIWLGVRRLTVLLRTAAGPRLLTPDQMAGTFCGIGLLGFLVHSLVEFNMHIPANAIVAALLAGAYLRPLRIEAE
jgi:O-antigen ligase